MPKDANLPADVISAGDKSLGGASRSAHTRSLVRHGPKDRLDTARRERKIERAIRTLRLETPISKAPRPARMAIARKRYGWIDFLVDIQRHPTDMHSLAETEAADTIFVHIPKTGGVSVAKSLFGSHVASHTPLEMYLALYGAKRFDRMFKFSFVRDPWTRVASAYHFLKAGGLTETDRRWAERHLSDFSSVDDFVERGLAQDHVRRWVHFRDQVGFLIDPRTGQLGVDFLGHFERLSEDFAFASKKLGIDRELPHLNKTKSSSHRPLSATSVEIISNVYARDIEMLGYRRPAP